MVDSGQEAAPDGPFDGVRWRAVAVGVVVDHVSTLVYATMLVAISASEDFFSKDPAVAKAARDALAESPSFVVSILLGGAICTVLAAFVAARYAADRYVLHGIWVAVASVAIVFGLDLVVGHQVSWFEGLGWLLVLPAGWLGGTLARWATEQQLSEESDAADE